MNYYILFMSLCVMSSQLISMQKTPITTANELKTLALAIHPEAYEETIKKYDVMPSAVTNSISVFLKNKYLPYDMSIHVERTREYNTDMYTKQIIQIMQEYYTRNKGQMSFSDQIKADTYAEVCQKISEEDDEIKASQEKGFCYLRAGLLGSVGAATFALLDFVIFMIWVTRT